MKSVLFGLSILFFAFNSILAQQTTSGGTSLYFNRSGLITDMPKQKQAPIGSVYLNDEWQKATIVLFDSTIFSDVDIKYNLLTKKLEVKQEGDTNIYTLYFSQIDRFVINGQIYKNCLHYIIQNPELGNCDFVRQLAQGKLGLYLNVYLDKLYANYNTTLDVGYTSDKYIKKNKYYVMKNGKLEPFNAYRGGVLRLMSDKKKEVKAYVRQNNLSYRKPIDLAKIFNYYNSLHNEKN